MSGRTGRWWLVLLAALVATVPLGLGDAAFAGPAIGTGRKVLGSMRTTGRVEGEIDGGQWLLLYPGSAVLDGMRIRVPREGTATLSLVGGDQVFFDAHSAGDISNDEGPRVRLDHGRLVLHLKPASTLVAEAGRGVVRTVPGKRMNVEAVVRRHGSETTLAVRQGILELRASGTDSGTIVEKGYQAVVGPSGPASGVMLSSSAPPAQRDQWAAAGFLGVGVAAAGGREGSPFRPILQ